MEEGGDPGPRPSSPRSSALSLSLSLIFQIPFFNRSNLGIANLKFLLLCFEEMMGLHINFHKSEVMVVGCPDLKQQRIANMLNCKRDSFPFTYLGLPICDRALTALDWDPLTCKVGKRTDLWMGKFMSSGARMIITNACLSNLPMHAMGVCMRGTGYTKR